MAHSFYQVVGVAGDEIDILFGPKLESHGEAKKVYDQTLDARGVVEAVKAVKAKPGVKAVQAVAAKNYDYVAIMDLARGTHKRRSC